MADTDRMIQPLYGPYSGLYLSVSAVEAETAIAQGWARDPYQAAPPRTLSSDELVAAEPTAEQESAADETAGGDADDATGTEGRDMIAGERGRYQTRAARPQGRPPRGRG